MATRDAGSASRDYSARTASSGSVSSVPTPRTHREYEETPRDARPRSALQREFFDGRIEGRAYDPAEDDWTTGGFEEVTGEDEDPYLIAGEIIY